MLSFQNQPPLSFLFYVMCSLYFAIFELKTNSLISDTWCFTSQSDKIEGDEIFLKKSLKKINSSLQLITLLN